MEYYEAANVLFDLRQFRPKPGTASTRDLLDFLGDPHDGVTYVQIAGSNGKGSTARMTEAILREGGLTSGLYTSPHFVDIRERIRIDGRVIPKSSIVSFVETVRPYLTERAATGDPVTFFEATTALALWHFGREDVDVAVLEVGIGGRFDATCVVDPAASAVTTISHEHTDILGETIEEIARDKAHVASRESPLVTAATGVAREAIVRRCRELHAERETGLATDRQVRTVGPSDADVTAVYGGRTNHAEARIELVGPDWAVDTRLPLLGAYQATNAGVAAALAREVADIEESTIARGLRSAEWPGRFEVMGRCPLVVLDGAHNPDACARLAGVLEEFTYDRLLLVIGAMHEKDHAGMAAALPTPDIAITTRPVRDRAEDHAALANVFARAGCPEVREIPAVAAGLAEALAMAWPDDCILVTGSLYTVAEARERWARTAIPKHIRSRDEARAALASADVDLSVAPHLPDAGVHRVLKTRVRRPQARWLEEELRALGGACATSGLDDTIEEPVDVVLMGTRGQFAALLEDMRDAPETVEPLVADLDPFLGGGHPVDGSYPWEDGPTVMGILNVTPDSFHDGGRFSDTDAAVERAIEMIDAGADIVDVGGESTRPGGDPVDADTERARVIPVIEQLADSEAMISVDTRKAVVARAALEAGADMINDVSGLDDPAMHTVAAENDVPLVVMHSIDTPVVPDRKIEYDDVVEDVLYELREQVIRAERAGLDRSQIVVDPGLGFGKSARESFTLLDRVGEFSGFGCPVMVGHSHKSMFDLIGRGPGDRLAPTIAATALAVTGGADIVRVHDVAANVAAVEATRTTRER